MHIHVDEALAAGPAATEELLARLARGPAVCPSLPLGRDRSRIAVSPARLDAQQSESLRRFAAATQRVLEAALRALHASEELRQRMRLSPRALWRIKKRYDGVLKKRSLGWQRLLFAARTPRLMAQLYSPSAPSPILRSRADGFFVDGSYVCIELNIGEMDCHVFDDIAEAYAQTPQLAQIVADAAAPDAAGLTVEALLQRHRSGNAGTPPAVAMLDAPQYHTAEQWGLARAFAARDVPVYLAGAGALTFDPNGVCVDGQRATLVVDEGSLSSRHPRRHRRRFRSIAHRAHLQGRAFVYPLPIHGAFHKGLLALISEGALNSHFPEAADTRALQTFASHLVWTRATRPGETSGPDGRSIDLRELCLNQREELVLKPMVASSGLGVLLGDQCSEAQWRAAVDGALLARDCIVQRRLRPEPHELVVARPVGERVRATVDISPLIIDGALAAVTSRYSTQPITNFWASHRAGVNHYGYVPVWTS